MRLNYKFESPVLQGKSNEDVEDGGRLADDAHEYERNSVEEEEKVGALAALGTQLNNTNSRFPSATTRADELEEERRGKGKEEGEEVEGKKGIMTSNIEPVAWRKEQERVAGRLEELDERIQRGEDIKGEGKEDFMHNLRNLKGFATVSWVMNGIYEYF